MAPVGSPSDDDLSPPVRTVHSQSSSGTARSMSGHLAAGTVRGGRLVGARRRSSDSRRPSAAALQQLDPALLESATDNQDESGDWTEEASLEEGVGCGGARRPKVTMDRKFIKKSRSARQQEKRHKEDSTSIEDDDTEEIVQQTLLQSENSIKQEQLWEKQDEEYKDEEQQEQRLHRHYSRRGRRGRRGRHHTDEDSHDEDESHTDSKRFLDRSSSHSGYSGSKSMLDERLFSSLPEGAFSFLVASPILSFPFMLALVVFALKTGIYALIATNLLGPDPTNPLSFPASVTAPVMISQFFALLIAVTTQDDVVQGLNIIYEGYQREELGFAYPQNAATFTKWILGVTAHLTDGACGLTVTFLLIVTSSDVVELLLNFTAIEFVSLLDNGAFLLSQLGFLGTANKFMADIVSHTEYFIDRKQKTPPTLQMWLLILSYGALLGAWGVVYSRQVRGFYTPGLLLVQFDDELDIRLGTYSGRYFLQNRVSSFGFDRIRYFAEHGPGMFAYCARERVWTFTDTYVDVDPCSSYTARSTFSTNFDITTTASDTWFVSANPEERRFLPMVFFRLYLGCILDENCGGIGRGTCSSNTCFCNEPFYGWRCDYIKNNTCDNMETDELLAETFSGTQPYARRFEILLHSNNKDFVRVYDHPVYLSEGFLERGNGDVLIFTGVRWGLFPMPASLLASLNTTSQSDLAAYFSNFPNVNIFVDENQEFFASDAVMFNAASDSSTPVGLAWSLGRREGGLLTYRATGAFLLCAVCGAANPCANNNTCGADGTCACNNGATGPLCRVTPISDGFCDPIFFNVQSFDYDGGDCCESTCINSNNNTCGVITLNDPRPIVIEYPNCIDPIALCNNGGGGSSCWAPKTAPFVAASAGGLGYNMFLTANGRVLVEGAPQSETVRIMDQPDSRWTPRGGTSLNDVRGSRFGSVVGVYTPPGDVAYGPDLRGVQNMVVAVGLYRLEQAALRVFGWDSIEQGWSGLGVEINLCSGSCVVDAVSVGRPSTNNIVMALSLDGDQVIVFGTTDYGPNTASITWNRVARIPGIYYALSGNGKVLAVLPQQGSVVDIYNIDLDNPLANKRVVVANSGDVGNRVFAMSLSYDGAFLNVVVSRGSGDNDVIRLDVTQAFPTTRYLGRAIGSLSRTALNAGFTPLSLAFDGLVLMEDDTREGAIAGAVLLKVWAFYGQRGIWGRVGTDFDEVNLDTAFDAAQQGTVLAVGRTGDLDVFELSPRCSDDSYRVSTDLGTNLAELSWSLRSYVTIGNDNHTVYTGTVDESCEEGCYAPETLLYAGRTLMHRGCIPTNECLTLTYQDTSATFQTYFRLFRNQKLLNQEGIAGETATEVVAATAADTCRLEELDCPTGQSFVVFALTLDHFAQDISWYLRDENDNTLMQDSNITLANDVATKFYRVCAPSDQCLSFSILDEYGDGLCCEYGKGSYSLFRDGQVVLSRNGDDISYGERIRFGSCPTQVVEPNLVTTTIRTDDQRDDLHWYITDGLGNLIGSWTYSDDGSSIIVTTSPFFSEDVVGCLSFFMEDAGEDGFFGNNTGYEVYLDGQLIVSRDGRFGFAERTTFGEGPFCPVNTIRSEFITVLVLVDRRPTELSWYIGNSTGVPVTGLFRPNPNQIRTVVRSFYDPIADNNPERCFTLTIMDTSGDGLCCTRGNGTYQVFFGWESLFLKKGDFNFGERVRFGRGCSQELEFLQGYTATVEHTTDDRPAETNWRLESAFGNVLVGVNGTTGDTDETIYWFPENVTDECLYFVVEDFGGDGVCCDGDNTGRYSLAVDKTTVYTSNGRYGFGERVRFGTPNCVLETIPLTAIKATVRPDSRSFLETSWYIGEGDTPISDVATGSMEDQPGDVRNVVAYVPMDDAFATKCFTFTIVDSGGDGVCCDSGNGDYVVEMGQQTVATSNGMFGYGERVLFGTPCPVETISGYAATVVVRANQTVWSIREESNLRVLASSSNNNIVASSFYYTQSGNNVTQTVFHFNDGCLLFTVDVPIVQDAINETLALAANDSYAILVDGVAVLERMEYGLGERVRFGRVCDTLLQQVSLLTVQIVLDAKPFETGWNLTEVRTGRLVADAPMGTYTRNDTIAETVRVYANETYLFVLEDAGLDGICCSDVFGDGSYQLYIETGNATAVLLIEGDGAFGDVVSHEFQAP